jgi:hypothetical protein
VNRCTPSAVKFIRPCIPTTAKAIPHGDAWLHEPKLDGYRFQIVKDGRQVSDRHRGMDHPDDGRTRANSSRLMRSTHLPSLRSIHSPTRMLLPLASSTSTKWPGSGPGGPSNRMSILVHQPPIRLLRSSIWGQVSDLGHANGPTCKQVF